MIGRFALPPFVTYNRLPAFSAENSCPQQNSASQEESMPTTLTIRDATLSGQTLNEWSLDFLTERITVRELIRSRVYQEVQDYNRRQPVRFQGLIQPAEEEQVLNGPARRGGKSTGSGSSSERLKLFASSRF
jgi:hypothetical protein